MKTFKIAFISLLVLTVFFGIKDLTGEEVAKGIVEKGWGTLNYWLGGNINVSNNRPLPPNQGDNSESPLTPIESLEDVK